MNNRTEVLKKYIVRIKGNRKCLGSGVLWRMQQSESSHLYIFTAAHVVREADNIEVEFLRNNEIVNLPVEQSMIKISEKYQNKGDFWDVAIITVNYEYNELPGFSFFSFQSDMHELCEGKDLIMYGFPGDEQIDQSFILSMDHMCLQYDNVDTSVSMLKYKIQGNIDQSNRNEEMEGFSGAGLFCDLGSEFVFLGIHKGTIGSNAPRGNLIGTTSDFVRDMCSKNNWDIPIQINKVNGNLSDQIAYFREEILDDLKFEDTEKVSSLLGNVTKQDLTDVINGIFCDFCEECQYKTNYHQCEKFRGFLLVILVFLKAVNNAVDLKRPQVIVDKEIPVYFVCSEGQIRYTQAKLKMNHFVYALKSCRELSRRLEDGCIIIWGSAEDPRDNEKKCAYSQYLNVLSDITRIPGNNLDIASVFSEPRPKAIIHIDEIIKLLRNGSLQKLKETFEEYIGELIK